VGTSTLKIQDGYYQNRLNGLDFNLVRFDVMPQTSNPVTSIPVSFAPLKTISTALVNATRSITFYPDTVTSGKQGYVDGPFLFNKKTFNMDSVNIISYLNNVEIWTLTNKTMVAHPFHIHDIQFFVLDINGNPPPPQLKGYKDVILVQPNEKVRFITKFEDFADDSVPYMYHCHLLHHEDDGMMGAFLVLDTTGTPTAIKEISTTANSMSVYQNFTENEVTIKTSSQKNSTADIFMLDVLGRKQKEVFKGNLPPGENTFKVNIGNLKRGTYLVVWNGDTLQCKKIIR
jgi:blue copper oxidase